MNYDFSTYASEIFNPLIYDLQDADTRFVINYGGAGSGKSYTQSQHEIMCALENKIVTLVLRKVSNTLNKSVVKEITDKLKEWKIPHDYNKTERIITFHNGSQIWFNGLDDPEKIKSISGLRRIWIEEASELDEADFDQLNLRLRGAEGLQMVLTFNPIDEMHWIKKRFFDSGDPDTTIIKTTYKNNNFLDSAYIKELEKYKTTDYNYYRVYALGDWGKLDSGAEFYKRFDPSVTVCDDVSYNPELPLLVGFDENVNPYFPAMIGQLHGNELHIFDEVAKEPPHNSVQHICTEITKRYRDHSEPMFIYGDATSRKKDVKVEAGYNLFSLIQKELKQFHSIQKIPTKNPSVALRGMFMNDVFDGKIQGVTIKIHSRCKLTIEDLKYVKEAADGTKLKENVKDPRTKVTYQKYGHFSDILDYMTCEIFRTEYRAFQRSGTTPKRVALKTGGGRLKY